MITSRSLLYIAVAYNIVNLLMWLNVLSLHDASSMIYLVIYPSFWIITLIVVGVISFKNKAFLFDKQNKYLSSIAIFFCTPVLFLSLTVLSVSKSHVDSSGFEYKDGYSKKYENWVFSNGKTEVVKYWKAKGNCTGCTEADYKKDSTWVYLSQKGDTLKVEIYKSGVLVSRK